MGAVLRFRPLELERALAEEGERILRDERGGEPVLLPVGQPHRDPRRETVPDEVDPVALDAQRVVDLDPVVAGCPVPALGVGDVGGEGARFAGGQVARGERVQRVDAERGDLTVLLEPAGAPGVELRDDVAETLALDDDHGPAVPPQSSDGDREQRGEQADMEQQVAALAAVALLGRHRARARLLVGAHDAPPAPAERTGHLFGGDVPLDRERRRLGQAGEVARCGKRLGPDRPEVQADPRDQAADEGDGEQQVDGREPRRTEHVEEAEPAEPRGQGPVAGVVLADLGRVERALGQQRSRHRGNGEQEQQDQRRPHRRQPAPSLADQAIRPGGPPRRRRWRPRRADRTRCCDRHEPTADVLIPARPCRCRPSCARHSSSGPTDR